MDSLLEIPESIWDSISNWIKEQCKDFNIASENFEKIFSSNLPLSEKTEASLKIAQILFFKTKPIAKNLAEHYSKEYSEKYKSNKFRDQNEKKYIEYVSFGLVSVMILILVADFYFIGNNPIDNQWIQKIVGEEPPDVYYLSLNTADVDSPIELIRISSSIRPDTSSLDINERVAYFEWFLKNHGFNVSFVSSDDFRGQKLSHLWLLVKNHQGESMYVEPSYIEMKTDSICPTIPEYKRYHNVFKDIYDLSRNTGGIDEYAWWKTSSGKVLFNKSVMLLKKNQL
jgi:hypothetical protein